MILIAIIIYVLIALTISLIVCQSFRRQNGEFDKHSSGDSDAKGEMQ